MTVEMAYVGRAQCGCIELLTMDTPENKREAAKEIGKVIRRGGSIERVTVEDARTVGLLRCEEHAR